MLLCMFHPEAHPMERGWVGRVDGDRVVHLAAQTLQSYFLGGGGAREHAEYARAEVVFLAPVLHPPTVRVFESEETFSFANAAAIVGPGSTVACAGPLELRPRVAAVVGAEGGIGGFTLFAEWRDPERAAPKDRDFALATGPLVVTPARNEETVALAVSVDGERIDARAPVFGWASALELAADNTTLRPGDLLAGPPHAIVLVPAGARVEVSGERLGLLAVASEPAT